MDAAGCELQLGPIPLRITSDVPQILEDYLHLYADYVTEHRADECLSFHITSRRRRPWSHREYVIRTTGREHVAGNDIDAGLPDLEALINQHVLQQRRDFLVLHACVMEHQGQGVLLPADSGTGKTTLAAGLIGRGWNYLSDEYALIDRADKCVHPFPKALCIKEKGFGLLKELGIRSERFKKYKLLGRYPRIFIKPTDIRPDSVGRPCPIKWFFLLARKGDPEVWLRRPTLGQTAMYIFRVGLNTLAHQQAGLETVVSLAQESNCLILHLADMKRNLDLLEEVLVNGPSDARSPLQVA